MYDIIFLDLDNTILDFDAAEREGFRLLIEESGLTYQSDMLFQYQKINIALWKAMEQGELTKEDVCNTRFHRFFQIYDKQVDGAVLEKRYRQYLDTSSGLMPYAEETLREIRKMGKKIYSASNGFYSTQLNRLSNAGIVNLFDGHFISDQIQYEKPSPLFFDACIRAVNADIRSILMVGDSPTSDIAGALCAHLDACFYQHGRSVSCPQAAYTIQELPELLHII